MTDRSLLVCATEISGDARGARLAGELLRAAPGLRIRGLGGGRMRAAGVDVRVDITDRGTVGWFDHWPDLACYVSALRYWRRELRDRRPAAAVVIDAPGISFPFARAARNAGVPLIYFVTPQTWLWNPRRAVERLRTHADCVIPTLPEEAALYERAGLQVIYEGHPALDDLLETYGDRPSNHRRAPTKPLGGQGGTLGFSDLTVALVPGSRRHTIRRLLPVMLDAVEIVKRHCGVAKAVVSVAAPALRGEVEACLDGHSRSVEVAEGSLGSALRASDVVLASTGGNLLEAAFAGVPAVACYRVDKVTHAIARYAMRLHGRLRTFALPNLVAGERIVPDLIQADVTAENLAAHALRLVEDADARRAMEDGYARVRNRLGRPGVNARIAGRLVRDWLG